MSRKSWILPQFRKKTTFSQFTPLLCAHFIPWNWLSALNFSPLITTLTPFPSIPPVKYCLIFPFFRLVMFAESSPKPQNKQSNKATNKQTNKKLKVTDRHTLVPFQFNQTHLLHCQGDVQNGAGSKTSSR